MKNKRFENTVRILFLVLFSILFILSLSVFIIFIIFFMNGVAQHDFDFLYLHASGLSFLEMLCSLSMILILLLIKDKNVINDQTRKSTRTTLLIIIIENLYFHLLLPTVILFCSFLFDLLTLIKIAFGIILFFYYPTIIILSGVSVVLLIKSYKLIKKGRQEESLTQKETAS